MTRTSSYKDYDCKIKVFFRIPFTMYFLIKEQQECVHVWSRFYLAVLDFEEKGRVYKILR